MIVQENVSLAPLTTLQVGGPARFYIETDSTDDVRDAVDFARSRSLPLFILGGGSNLLVSDSGWPGVVLHIAPTGIHAEGGGCYDVGAGVSWDDFVSLTVREQCQGIECLSGIPGTVGGTPIQNVGAYGQEVSTCIVSVHVLDLHTGRLADLPKSECGFRYRTSIFNSAMQGRYIVLGVTYQLNPGAEPTIEYADLTQRFANRRPTLQETRDAVREIRRGKGMLIDPDDADSRSAGSFFKNPVVTASAYEALASQTPLKVPHWPADQDSVKISAAWLVEQAGFTRGYHQGAVGISTKHALALVNRGGATAKEIWDLKDTITQRVADRFGVALKPEPVLVGDFRSESRVEGS